MSLQDSVDEALIKEADEAKAKANKLFQGTNLNSFKL